MKIVARVAPRSAAARRAASVAPSQHDRGVAAIERIHEAGAEHVGPVVLAGVQHAVAAADRSRTSTRRRLAAEQRAVRVQDALRIAGRARRVDEVRRVVRTRRVRVARRARRRPARRLEVVDHDATRRRRRTGPATRTCRSAGAPSSADRIARHVARSVTIATAPESRARYDDLVAPSAVVDVGTAIAPRFIAPRNAVAYSRQFGSRMRTRSPAATSSARSDGARSGSSGRRARDR